MKGRESYIKPNTFHHSLSTVGGNTKGRRCSRLENVLTPSISDIGHIPLWGCYLYWRRTNKNL